MNRTARLLAGTLATLTLTAGLATATATTTNALPSNAFNFDEWPSYQPATPRTASPGMYFDFAGDLSRPNGVGWSSKACSMGPFPRYGMCTMSIPATLANRAPARCSGPPTPEEPQLTLPGLARL